MIRLHCLFRYLLFVSTRRGRTLNVRSAVLKDESSVERKFRTHYFTNFLQQTSIKSVFVCQKVSS